MLQNSLLGQLGCLLRIYGLRLFWGLLVFCFWLFILAFLGFLFLGEQINYIFVNQFAQ